MAQASPTKHDLSRCNYDLYGLDIFRHAAALYLRIGGKGTISAPWNINYRIGAKKLKLYSSSSKVQPVQFLFVAELYKA